MRWIFYRWFMRLAHKYDWHYAPMIGPMEDGATQRWCKWCGFRETYRPRGERTKAGIMALRQQAEASIEKHFLQMAGARRSKEGPEYAGAGWAMSEKAGERGNEVVPSDITAEVVPQWMVRFHYTDGGIKDGFQCDSPEEAQAHINRLIEKKLIRAEHRLEKATPNDTNASYESCHE